MVRFIKRVRRTAALAITCVILAAGMLGCTMEDAGEDRLKDIDFTVVGVEQQPETLREIIEEKSADAFQISYTIGSDLYIAIGYGEQPSGGYSISVNEFYETQDALFIDTTLTGPGKAENVTNTPTKPYIVIKTENIADKKIEFR